MTDTSHIEQRARELLAAEMREHYPSTADRLLDHTLSPESFPLSTALAIRAIATALSARASIPKINVKCETSGNGLTGTTFLNVVRVEQEDDNTFTAVTDHWPSARASAGEGGWAEYETRMGEAGDRYICSVALNGSHTLPAQFRWHELWDVLNRAAAPQPAQTQGWGNHLAAIRSLVSPLQFDTICEVFREQDALAAAPQPQAQDKTRPVSEWIAELRQDPEIAAGMDAAREKRGPRRTPPAHGDGEVE